MAWSEREERCGFKFYSELSRKVDFETAPVSSMSHVPLAFQFEENVVEGLLVELAHKNGYWYARVMKRKGYLVLLRWIGAEADSEKWRNFAAYEEPGAGQLDERVHHLGWGRDRKLERKPPQSIEEELMNKYGPNLDNFIKDQIATSYVLEKDVNGIAKKENEGAFREEMKVEVSDTTELHVSRPAVIVRNIGRRFELSFLDDEGEKQFCWLHEFSNDFRPQGWGGLIGRKVKPPEYYEESKHKLTEFSEPRPEDGPKFKKLLCPIPLKKWLEKKHFTKNTVLEVIDPLRPGISVGTIVKVLWGYFLEIEIEHEKEWGGHKKYKICVPAFSECLLRPGFVKDHKLEKYFNPPPFSYESKPKVPRGGLERHTPDNDFSVGQLLEVASVIGGKLINVGRIIGKYGHLLHIHYEDWAERHDHFFSMRDPNLYPVGWCDLVGHELTTPIMRRNLKPGTVITKAFVIPKNHR